MPDCFALSSAVLQPGGVSASTALEQQLDGSQVIGHINIHRANRLPMFEDLVLELQAVLPKQLNTPLFIRVLRALLGCMDAFVAFDEAYVRFLKSKGTSRKAALRILALGLQHFPAFGRHVGCTARVEQILAGLISSEGHEACSSMVMVTFALHVLGGSTQSISSDVTAELPGLSGLCDIMLARLQALRAALAAAKGIAGYQGKKAVMHMVQILASKRLSARMREAIERISLLHA